MVAPGWDGGVIGADIIPLEPGIDNDGKPYPPLLYSFPMGNGGSANENSALVWPFRKIIREGKPIGRIGYVFYQEKQDYRILGSFAYGGGESCSSLLL